MKIVSFRFYLLLQMVVLSCALYYTGLYHKSQQICCYWYYGRLCRNDVISKRDRHFTLCFDKSCYTPLLDSPLCVSSYLSTACKPDCYSLSSDISTLVSSFFQLLTVFFQTGIRALTQKEFVVNQIVEGNLRVVVHLCWDCISVYFSLQWRRRIFNTYWSRICASIQMKEMKSKKAK